MNKIVVIGSSNTDMVVKTSHLPIGGETVLGGDFFMNAGGKGANQAVAAARYGNKVIFVAKTGDDLFGRQVREALKEDKIITDYVFVDEEHPSGVALITIDKHAENCIVVASGANMHLGADDIDKAKEEEFKAICFVTGVPGAGKTLVGLDVAVRQTYQGNDEPVEDEHILHFWCSQSA